jgi:hypothetical protein
MTIFLSVIILELIGEKALGRRDSILVDGHTGIINILAYAKESTGKIESIMCLDDTSIRSIII